MLVFVCVCVIFFPKYFLTEASLNIYTKASLLVNPAWL